MTLETTLKIVKGSTKPMDVFLFDDNDVAEDLSSGTLATLVVKDALGVGVDLERSVTDGNLSIGSGKLTATIEQDEADALVPGTYIGEAAVRIGATDWIHTDPFYVEVLDAIAPHA